MDGSSDEPGRLVISLIAPGGALRTDRQRTQLLNGNLARRSYGRRRLLNSQLNLEGGMKADYTARNGEIVLGPER
jgi:hypothetical protein